MLGQSLEDEKVEMIWGKATCMNPLVGRERQREVHRHMGCVGQDFWRV
jgi:hypothetical protein